MIRPYLLMPIFLTLSACGPSSEKDDPIRVEFVDACMQMKPYQSMQADKRTKLCNCTYDTSVSGLSGEAQNAARFYLLEQAGVEAASKNLISKPPNMSAMLDASKAIGEAVRQCR